jgi:lipopolysaccharide/colanic/teichoic acid biosynthesis glycosyltransferase
VSARQDPSFKTSMDLDLEYIESWGLWTDARILWSTIPAVMKGQGQ